MQNTSSIPVRLTEAGLDCYRRNQDYKHLPPTTTTRMFIIGSCGFDSGRKIFRVGDHMDPEKCTAIDYYFEDCLETAAPGGAFEL